jgi:hypothetical protein
MTRPVSLSRIEGLTPTKVDALSNDELADLMRSLAEYQDADRRECQLRYYKPVSDRAAEIHKSKARVIGVFGGNRSSKTETCMAEIVALATGILPNSVRDELKPKFRGPVSCRIVIESLTTTLEPTILPKLQFWKWSGRGKHGSDQGHWGWVPKFCLKGGGWDKAYHTKNRILTLLCRNPDDEDEILGESTIQFMSHDQDPTDFASGEFHHILMDEPPKLAIWRENEARIMSVGGRMYLAMTWPDDPSIPVDWIHDEVYERGVPGPMKAPDVEVFELHSLDNPHIDQVAVRAQMAGWSDEMRQIRIFGRSIRFSNRIHPLFTDIPQFWSFSAGKIVFPTEQGVCPETRSRDIAEFCHVRRIEPSNRWPTLFLLDPHPRKPHMFMWAQIDGNDDISIVLEGKIDGSPQDVRDFVFHVEQSNSLKIADRLIDPNMGRSPSSAARREITWQDEFAEAGLNCALADDSDVGRGRINDYLRPDLASMKPRLEIDERCSETIFQLKRYVWDNYRRQDERDLKQVPKAKNDDYPTLIKYLLNSNPTFSLLQYGAPTVHYNRGFDKRTAVRVGVRH